MSKQIFAHDGTTQFPDVKPEAERPSPQPRRITRLLLIPPAEKIGTRLTGPAGEIIPIDEQGRYDVSQAPQLVHMLPDWQLVKE